MICVLFSAPFLLRFQIFDSNTAGYVSCKKIKDPVS